jgi:hypothetical protein
MDLYTLQDIRVIFSHCSTIEEIRQVGLVFRWLITYGFQQRSDALQLMALQRMSQII